MSNADTSHSRLMDLMSNADAPSTELLRWWCVSILGKQEMPEKKISFTVHGKVVGKGRPHFVRKTGVALTPQRTRSYESVIRDAAHREMVWEPWDAPVVAVIRAYYEIPKSWSKAKKELAQHQLVAPSKPDVDNIVKIVLDACNRTVYLDDTQVVTCISQKLWGDKARLEVEFVEV